MYDLIIIGSGPAGLTAGIYAERAKIKTLILEENYVSGGQIISTYEIDNYPGMPGVSGIALAQCMKNHAEKAGAVFKTAKVTGVENKGKTKIIYTEKESFETKAILIASGAGHSKLGLLGEEELIGRGVSYCATCDGAFFKEKDVAIVGGGNVAVEDAIFLARLCRKVYIIHRRNEFRAEKILQETLFSLPNAEIIWDSEVVKFNQKDGMLESLSILNKKTAENRKLAVSGVFIAVGIMPKSDIFKMYIETDQKGYIKAGEDCKTSVEGIFAAGDIRTKAVRQIITAAGDGANAIYSINRYLIENF